MWHENYVYVLINNINFVHGSYFYIDDLVAW